MGHELHDLSDTTFEHTRLREARFSWIDLSGAWVRHVGVRDVRMRGVELADVEIDGELENVVINGVDVAPLIEAELERRDPDYAKMKPKTPTSSARPGTSSKRRWAETVDQARPWTPSSSTSGSTASGRSSRRLRHLCYATDAWVNRVYLGEPDPWSPLDLPFDTLRDLQWRHDRDVRPTLDEVLALRADRQATVRRVLADLTDAGLEGQTTPVEGEGWPPADSYPVAEALGIVVNEEWHHRRFAERDLATLGAR